jgi:hypothetical protein
LNKAYKDTLQSKGACTLIHVVFYTYLPKRCFGKKFKLFIINFKKLKMKSLQKLTRAEMKNVRGGVQQGGGGGCCCAHNADGFDCGMSQSDAQTAASGLQGGKWCCASCSSVGAPAPCEE